MGSIILVVIGLIGGIIGSLVGLGGGIVIVPALLFFGTYTVLLPEITPQVAVGTSLLVIIFTGLASTLTYMKHKTVDYKSGLIFFLGSGPGGILGAFVNKLLNMQSFLIYFGFFIILTSFILMFKDRIKRKEASTLFAITRTYRDRDGEIYTYGFHPLTAWVLAFIVGVLSGLFGIGGGSLLVPAMILLFAFPPHVAVATSMFMIFLSSILSSITHISLGNVNWSLALFLVPGAWIGGRLGAVLNTKMKSKTVINVLRIALMAVGIRLIYQGLF